jgi:hypothetical protein
LYIVLSQPVKNRQIARQMLKNVVCLMILSVFRYIMSVAVN